MLSKHPKKKPISLSKVELQVLEFSTGLSYQQAIDRFVTTLCTAAIKMADGNSSEAARRLSVHRNTFHRNMKAARQ